MATKVKDEAIVKSEKATRKLAAYIKEHKLDPKKDYSKHPEHGEFIRKMQKRIKVGSEKAVEAVEKAKNLKKPDVHPKKEKVTAAPTSYDYPDINGKPMAPELKKKYRQKMRTLTGSGIKKADAEKKALEFVSNATTSAKPSTKAKAKEETKPSKKADKKKETKAEPEKVSKKVKSKGKDKAEKSAKKSSTKKRVED